MSFRREQVNSTLHKALQQVLARGLQDPRVSGLITVTNVEVSADLKAATVWVSILPEEKQQLVLHGLKHAATHIRRRVGELVALRQMPGLTFKLDMGLKKQAQVLEAINRAKETSPEGHDAPQDQPSDAAPPKPDSEASGDTPE